MNIAANRLNCIEDKIGYNFQNRELLEEAFTHSSYNSIKNNEILEFEGDKILNAIIGIHLSKNYKLDEGILSKLTTFFVDNKNILPKVCLKHGLDKLINITEYEKNNKNSRENWIPSLLEALIGAIFKDSGEDWITTKKIVQTLYGDELILDDKRIKEILHKCDPVTSLKEYCDEHRCLLEFDEQRVDGLDNDPKHVGYVWIDGEEYRGDEIRGKKSKARENVCEKVLSALLLI